MCVPCHALNELCLLHSLFGRFLVQSYIPSFIRSTLAVDLVIDSFLHKLIHSLFYTSIHLIHFFIDIKFIHLSSIHLSMHCLFIHSFVHTLIGSSLTFIPSVVLTLIHSYVYVCIIRSLMHSYICFFISFTSQALIGRDLVMGCDSHMSVGGARGQQYGSIHAQVMQVMPITKSRPTRAWLERLLHSFVCTHLSFSIHLLID